MGTSRVLTRLVLSRSESSRGRTRNTLERPQRRGWRDAGAQVISMRGPLGIRSDRNLVGTG